MKLVLVLVTLLSAYLIGSIPIGLVIVRLVRGRDIRYWFSGRTGGTNVMRMAGVWAGVATGILDLLKGTAAVWLARAITADNAWITAAAGVIAVIGHNYSVLLLERVDGRVRFRGGAGGATAAGGAVGLWFPAVLILVPVGVAILYLVGFASVATMSIGVVAAVIFTWRALAGVGPWAYVFFAIGVEALLLWALRPNIVRLIRGEERLVGLRARKPRRNRGDQRVDGNPLLNS
jgi:glycerol-3-phosphate acyltransferase PlsY